MNLHENKDAFAAAIQLDSAPEAEGGLGIKQNVSGKRLLDMQIFENAF
jgi:hypothetical protein